MRKLQVFRVLIKIHQKHNKTKVLCKFDGNNSSIFTYRGGYIFSPENYSGFNKLAAFLMFIKFASGTIKHLFGANLMKTAVYLLIPRWLSF